MAQTAGFCFGVKRAVDTVYKEIEKGEKIYTYGPIIHNEEVVSDLKNRGVGVIETADEIANIHNSTVIIRSHGVPKKIYELIEKSGNQIVDATCPFVKKIHNIVEKASNANEKVIVIGSKNHPEVIGIIGWCNEDNPAIVVENAEEAEKITINAGEKINIVSQTTFRHSKFQELVEIFSKKGYDVNVVNTICNATAERQEEARKIAASVDAMIVIGDSKSSNTQKLYEICSRECEFTQYVQTKDNLVFDSKESLSRVGITAGASTPNKIIEEVQNYVRINF